MELSFLKMQTVGVENIADPIDADGEGLDTNVVLAPKRVADVVEGTARPTEPECKIP